MKNLMMFRKSLDLSLVAVLVVVLGGCAEAPTKSTAVEAAKVDRSMAYMSTRVSTDTKGEQCPVSPTAWHKENLSKLLTMANACAQAKKNERLEDMANFMAEQFVAEPWGAFYLSVAAEQRHDLPRALWMIELAIKKSPHGGILYYQRGRVHWQLNETGLAIEDYGLAVKENSRLVDAHLILAQYSLRANDVKSAEAHYQQCVASEPDNASFLAPLAEIEVTLNHPKYAIELYERAVSATPRNLEYRFRLGYLYEITQKNYEQALSTYRHIKSMMSESRAPADARSAEVNDKIKKLEALVSPEPKEEPKITSAEKTPQVQVKK
jgi:tetratricopeptide (TPR) repeat protein